MIRKICADGKKRTKTKGSSYFHNSYFMLDTTLGGVSDEAISDEISRMMSADAGVPVDTVFFVEIDDAENQFTCPNDLVNFQESKTSKLPIGAHRFVVCNDDLFREYMATGVDA